jgi:hypothetical protein
VRKQNITLDKTGIDNASAYTLPKKLTLPVFFIYGFPGGAKNAAQFEALERFKTLNQKAEGPDVDQCGIALKKYAVLILNNEC